jgi:hypothetical protein
MKNTLKITVIIILLMNFYCLLGQSVIGLAVYQDPKLAFFEDDYGNTPFTLDISGKFKFQAEERQLGFWSLNGKYRYAELYYDETTNDATGYLTRYGIELQYYFNLNTNQFHFVPTIGYGWMRRSNTMWMRSWEFGGEISYRIGNSPFKLLLEGIYMERPDLPNLGFRFNGSVGLQFDLMFTDYMAKQARKGTRF